MSELPPGVNNILAVESDSNKIPSLSLIRGSGSFNMYYDGGGNIYTSTGPFSFGSANAQDIFISSTHLVGIGTTTLTAKLTLQGTTSDNTANALQVNNSSGTGLVTVRNDGNVGIGTTSPQAKLDVWGNVQIGTSSTPNLFVNTATGNVGIGNNNPSYLLDVQGGSTPGTKVFSVSGTGNVVVNEGGYGNGGVITAYSKASSDTLFDIYNATLDRGGGNGGAGLGLGYLFNLENGAGNRTNAGRFVFGWTDPTAGAEKSFFALQTQVNGTMTEGMRLVNGNVGIGTTSPSQKLTVSGGNVLLDNNTAYQMLDSGGVARSIFNLTSANNLQIGNIGQVAGSVSMYSNNNISFIPGASSVSNTALFIKYDGNVGIGTTSPSQLLTVGNNNQFTVDTSGDVSSKAYFYSNQSTAANKFMLNNPGNSFMGISGNSNGTNSTMSLGYSNGVGTLLTPVLTVEDNGNVGIGTTSPPQKLTVGSSSGGGNELISNGWLCVTTGDQCSGIGSPAAGTVYAVSSYTLGADVAENYPTNDKTLTAGDVVAADTGFPVYVTKASSTSPILGIVSTKPGVLLNGYGSQNFANAANVPVALAGRVPVNVSNENGSINIGDYLAPSKQFPGYLMKATQAGFALGRALENFTSSSTSATPNLGYVLIFIQPTQYVPKVADLLQNGANSDNQAWLQSLADLNMTNASVFGDIVVQGSLAVQKDLHVGGVIYAASLNVDSITAKKVTSDEVDAKKLCVGDVCVTPEQFLKMVQQANVGDAPADPSSPTPSPTPPANPPGQVAPQSDSGLVAGTSTPPSDTPPVVQPDPTPAPTDADTGNGSALQQTDNVGSGTPAPPTDPGTGGTPTP